ncbi:hypothetical protein [Catenulispora rubra]|uniref:hypothetical protein n=1 Tax=Catenulispora rubra TaxID=280293 RepID=UPI0018920B48|nr:hypothetical protein [Catenulispora rubra]
MTHPHRKEHPITTGSDRTAHIAATAPENPVPHRSTARRTLTITAAVATAGALAAGLFACSSGTGPTTVRSPAAPATSAPATPSTTAPAGGVSGAALRALLPTSAQLAAGITASGIYDTGTGFTAEADLPAPSLPGADCTAAPSLNADVATADFRAAYASEELDKNGNSLQLIVAATNPGDAAKQLAEIRALAARCASFSAPDATGASVGGTVQVDTFAGIGDEAIRIRVAAAGPNAAKYSQPEVILVRVGDKLAAVSDNDQAHNEAAAVSVARYLAQGLAGKPL